MKRLLSMVAISMMVVTAVVVAQAQSRQLSIIDLGTLVGGTVSQVSGINGINDHGQVVGFGITAAGVIHAVLWTKKPIR